MIFKKYEIEWFRFMKSSEIGFLLGLAYFLTVMITTMIIIVFGLAMILKLLGPIGVLGTFLGIMIFFLGFGIYRGDIISIKKIP